MSKSDTTATIKFFNASNTDSDTGSDEDKFDDDIIRGSSQNVTLSSNTIGSTSTSTKFNFKETNPENKIKKASVRKDSFSDDSDDNFEVRDREESIYDLSSSVPNYDLSTRLRDRTDSDSNLYLEDENPSTKDEILILDMMEDHFGLPEDLTRLRDITQEIEKLKQQIFMTTDENPDKGRLIEKLISLRLRKSELENIDNGTLHLEPDMKMIYGHEFHRKDVNQNSERFCEVCSTLVWGVIQSWYTCSLCGICCHDKCINSLKRMCASKKITETSVYITDICSDKGLSSQTYKCYECQAPISYKAGCLEPRQCDYTGHYYCPVCHWNDETVIPARVVHNWDFTPYKVCRASRQYLKLMYKRPVISFKTHHTHLFKYVEELNEMKKLREEILMMKVYFLSCQAALQSKLLKQLKDRQHFVDNADIYTLHDLVKLVKEQLLPAIVRVHASFASHIKVECETCRGKGYFCEVCQKPEVIFPFDNICTCCPECSNVFHKYCFLKVKSICPRCERKRKRMEECARKAELLRQIEETNSN